MKIECIDYVYLLCMVVVLFLLCLLLVKKKKLFTWLKKWILIPFTFIGGVIVYYIGFNDGGSAEHLLTLILRSALSSIHMFLLHSDLLEVKQAMHHDGTYMLFFSLIHFLAFTISFMVIIQLFGKQFLSWLKLKLSRPQSSYIFFDINDPSVALANDLLKNDKDRFVVFVDKNMKHKTLSGMKSDFSKPELEEQESLFDQLSRMDVALINKDCSDTTPLKKAGLGKLVRSGHAHLFFLSDNEDYNIQLALKVLDEIGMEEARGKETKGWNVVLYVNASSESISGLFAEKIRRYKKDIDIRLINKYNLSAIELITHYPPVDCVKVDTDTATVLSDLHVMVIGFGQLGNVVVRYLTEQGQFAGSTFHATVVDKEMDSKRGLFECKYPGLKRYSIAYEQAKVNSTEFFDLLKSQLDTLDYIVVTLGKDELNMKTALDLWHYVTRETDRPIKILANAYNSHNYKYLNASSTLFENMYIFGSHKEIFTEEVIVNEGRAAAAKKIHAYYNSQSGKKDDWKELSLIKKITNLSAATHMYAKLKLIGCDVSAIRHMENEETFISYLGERKWGNLARGEHLHWNATLFANGWTTWPLQTIPPTASLNKDEKHKKHACLVDWEDLKKIEARFGDNYQQYDHDSIVAIYKLVKAGILTEEDMRKSKWTDKNQDTY